AGRVDAAAHLSPGRQGARQVRGHRRERPLYAEVRQAGEVAARLYHISLRRAPTSTLSCSPVLCRASPPAPSEPRKVTASRVFSTFSVMKRLRLPYTCASPWRGCWVR